MTLAALIIVASVVGQPATARDQVPSTDPVVQIGLYGYGADGTLSVSAYDTDPSLESTVWVSASLCQVGAGHRELPAMAAYAWRFSGKVLSKSRDEAVILVEWQRVFDDGKVATAPSGSVQLTLKPGDHVPLDSIAGSMTQCPITSAAFEARYAPRVPPVTWGKRTSGGGGGGGVGAAAGGGGGGGGSGSGRGSGGGTMARAGSGGGGGRVPGAGLIDVDLWLVHNAPGQEERVLHQLLRSSLEGAVFAFAPVTIDTPRGAVIVQISGSFAVTPGTFGGQQLVFVTNRRVTSAQTDEAPRDTFENQGSSRTTNPLPGRDEVVSFEMPPVRLIGRPSPPDQFAVRVRITPR